TREAPRMWQEYTNGCDSVAIATTVGHLASAVGKHCHGFSVRYIDEGFAVPELHSLAPYAYKRPQFAYEREFRLVHVLPPESAIYLDQSDDFQRLIAGDPGEFVHELRFHPEAAQAFKERVRQEIAALGYSFPVTDSMLSRPGAAGRQCPDRPPDAEGQ